MASGASDSGGWGALIAFAAIGTIMMVWVAGANSCTQKSPIGTGSQTNSGYQGNSGESQPRPSRIEETQPRRERRYRDSHGAIISESETEDNLRQLRSNIRSMPDNNRRAYLEGVLQGLEEEWERIKRNGPIDE